MESTRSRVLQENMIPYKTTEYEYRKKMENWKRRQKKKRQKYSAAQINVDSHMSCKFIGVKFIFIVISRHIQQFLLQYLVEPPLASIHGCKRRGIEANKLVRYSGVSRLHTLREILFISSRLVGFLREISFFMSPHTFSIGFRSGLFPGHPSKILMPRSAWQFCVNVKNGQYGGS